MTSPPALKIFHDQTSETVPCIYGSVRAQRSTTHLLGAIAFSAVVHLVVIGSGSILEISSGRNGGTTLSGVPSHVLLFVFVAFVLAQCSLTAIWLARSLWPIYIKALAGVAVLCCAWLLLLGTMESTQDKLAAAAWAAALAIQMLIVFTVTIAIEFAVNWKSAVARSRFSLLHLLICTTLVAILFSGARLLAARQGFELADLPQWGFLVQLQSAAFTSAVLGAGILASLRLPQSWTLRIPICCAILLGITFAAPSAFLFAFGANVGATLTEMRWHFGCEGIFLIATLGPLEVLWEENEKLCAQVASPDGNSLDLAENRTGGAVTS
jgi:hypothetical protein